MRGTPSSPCVGVCGEAGAEAAGEKKQKGETGCVIIGRPPHAEEVLFVSVDLCFVRPRCRSLPRQVSTTMRSVPMWTSSKLGRHLGRHK